VGLYPGQVCLYDDTVAAQLLAASLTSAGMVSSASGPVVPGGAMPVLIMRGQNLRCKWTKRGALITQHVQA
jgi:hypothetical protein